MLILCSCFGSMLFVLDISSLILLSVLIVCVINDFIDLGLVMLRGKVIVLLLLVWILLISLVNLFMWWVFKVIGNLWLVSLVVVVVLMFDDVLVMMVVCWVG